MFRLTRYSLAYNTAWDSIIDNVNSDQFTIKKPGLTKQVAQYTAKFEPPQATLMYHINRQGTEIPYWETKLELTIRLDTWRINVLNRGFAFRQQPGDIDDHGNKVPYPFATAGNDNGGMPATAAPRLARFHDARGNIVPPVLLDIKGQRLTQGSKPVYIQYSIYDETPFAPLQL